MMVPIRPSLAVPGRRISLVKRRNPIALNYRFRHCEVRDLPVEYGLGLTAVACFSPLDSVPFTRMNKTVIEVQVRAVLPTSGGCAVFLGNNDKVFIIYVDQTVGSAITMFMREISKERPLTHDLIAHLMTALGARVERVIINDLKNATYYARMIIRAENELQQKKIIELDGRPSDCIAMATQQKAPIYVSQEVWDEVDDMSDVLRKMEEEGLKPDPEAESTEEE